MAKLKKVFSLICLMATAVVSIATSKAPNSAPDSSFRYGAASNCPDAIVTNQSITVLAGGITSPSGMDFSMLGLPTATVSIGQQTIVSGMVNGQIRSCTYSYDAALGAMHIYSCTDNGFASCQVSFTSL